MRALLLVTAALLLLAPAPPSTAWSRPEGAQVAAGTARVLEGEALPAPSLDMTVLDADMNAPEVKTLITGPTLLFYFSASCPHCQVVAPEVGELAKKLAGQVQVLGVASSRNGLSEIEAFKTDFGADFPMYKDFARRFASENQLTSTPSVLLVRPTADGFETLDAWRPFSPGTGLLVELRLRAAAGQAPWAAFEAGRYYGGGACGSCHVQENTSWGLSHHSIAYWTLYDREKAEDPACVRCHVTGLGEPTGFVLGDHGSAKTDVTCEACHGPGGPHAGSRTPVSEARNACVSCHDADHSIRFDVDRAVPHIDHWAAVGMAPATFRSAREDLLQGRAGRPLLAFPEGQNLGVKSCASCHKKEHKAWKKGPHAGAMKRLKERNLQDDVSCVACHAVAGTKAPTAAGDYLVGDGVGCEACHGPGEQHVAAEGGTENVVGLGESCPECVIEAICTTCHTPEQDPDWNLESALKGVHK